MTSSSKVTTFADVTPKCSNGHGTNNGGGGAGGSVGTAKELNAWYSVANDLYDVVVFLIASLGFVVQVSCNAADGEIRVQYSI